MLRQKLSKEERRTRSHRLIGADLSETQKTDKDGFMEASEGEVPFD